MIDTKHIDGQTSTFIPGKKGPTGRRARVTFISSYSEGQATDANLIEQYEITNNSKIDALVSMEYQYHGQSDYPVYNCIDDSDEDTEPPYRYGPTVPVCSCGMGPHTPTEQNEPFGCDSSSNEFISGDIIEDEAWIEGTDENSFIGYKFYERDIVTTDSSRAYTAKIPNSYISIIVPGFDTVPKLVRRLNEYPEEYDYIIFVDKNVTYLLMITSVTENEYYEPIACHCKILDTWKKSDDMATYIANINDITDNIKLYIVNHNVKKIITDDTKIINTLANLRLHATEESDVKCDVYTKRINDEITYKNFLIVSSSLKPIGDYKITVEFLYKKDNPFVDSVISDLFSTDENDNSLLGAPYNFRKGLSFDDENLNTFEVIIKDYEDGKNELSFNSTKMFYIPEHRQNDYVAYFYIYYKKLNGGYNKVLVNKMPYKEFINSSDDILPKKN